MSKLIIARKTYFSSAVNSNKSAFGHGYNFCLEAFVKGEKDPVSGLVMNLTDLNEILEQLKSHLDHKHINKEIEEFKNCEYSCSALAKYCFQFIDRELAKLNLSELYLHKVALSQGDNIVAECTSDQS